MNKFTYDSFGQIELPTFVLSSAAHKHYGIIQNIDPASVSFTFNMNNSQEGSFEVHKEVDGQRCLLWDKITSFRYVYCPEQREYYKMDVTIMDSAETIKQCTLTSAGEYELSNILLTDFHINDEYDYDMQYEQYGKQPEATGEVYNYETTVLYRENPQQLPQIAAYSLLDRVLSDKAVHWSIGYVAQSLVTPPIQRTFTATNQTIYDFLTNTVAKEINCMFKFNSVSRKISVFDLWNHCIDCGERGDFTNKCPKCGSTNIGKGYGTDTGIYISTENYAEKITVDGDEGNVKNCFFVTGGDDYMNATIRMTNPSMDNYIYNFSAMDYDDMPSSLAAGLTAYNDFYNTQVPIYEEYRDKYYEAVNQYYWYKHSMMPRSNAERWKGSTGYSVGDRAFVMTLPTWCYLECSRGGISGIKEFDATTVSVGDTFIDGTVEWTVKQNMQDLAPTAEMMLVIQQYLNSNPIMFKDSYPSNKTITTSVRNIAALSVDSLYKITVIEDDRTMPIVINTPTASVYETLKDLSTNGNVDVMTRTEINNSNLQLAGWTVSAGSSAVFGQVYTVAGIDKYYLFTPIVENVATGVFSTVMTPSQLSTYATNVINGTQQDSLRCLVGSYSTEAMAKSVALTIDAAYAALRGVSDTWSGYIKIENQNDKEDVYTGALTNVPLKLVTNYDTFKNYVKQVVDTRTNKDEKTFAGIFKIDDLNEFKTALESYGLESLNNFYKTYQAVLETLVSNGVEKDKPYLEVVDAYTDIYVPYEQKLKAIDDEIKVREKTVNDWKVEKEKYGGTEDGKTPGLMQQIAEQLNLRNYLGDEDYKAFRTYVRESLYTNSNYVAGEQSDGAILNDAKQLLELARTELKKACELQYTLNDDLYNLLNTKEFSDYKHRFELGDYIFCRADEDLYKLRLIQVKYDFNNPTSLNVTFSNATKIQGYFSDVQSVLNQATSMATTYDSVSRQVVKNTGTTGLVDDWMNEGLNATLAMIKNNNMEEVTVDNRGVISRQYDDTTELYSPEEVRITHNSIQFTKDAWETSSLALGKYPNYQYFHKQDNEWKRASGYGLISDFVYSGVVLGSQMIAGDIYSQNYNPDNGKGAHIDLNNGDFYLADGKITWNNNARELDVDGYIVARSLRLVPHADTNLSDVALSGDASDLTGLASVATSGNAADLNDIADYAKKADIPPSTTVTHSTDPATGVTTTNVITTEGTYSIYSAESSDGCMVYGWGTGDKTSGHTGKYFKVSKEGLLEADNAIIYGEIHATKGVFHGRVEAGEGYIAGWSITDSSIYNTNSSGNTVFVSNATNPNQDYLVVRTGNGTSVPYNYPFFVRGDGTLVATKATITGSITATSGSFTGSIIANSGQIGNWYIHNGAMYNTNSTSTATAFVGVNEIGFADAKLKSVGGLEANEITGTKFWIHNNGDFGTAGTITSSGAITSSKGGTFGENVTASKNIIAASGTLYAKGATTSGSAANCRIAASGNDYGKIMIATGSSMKYKHAFSTTLNDELDPHKLYNIPIYQYRYQTNYLKNEKDIRYDRDLIGFIAESMDKYYPIAAEWHYDEKTNKRVIDDWNERYIIPPMLKLVQEQHAEIEELKARLLKLEEVEK